MNDTPSRGQGYRDRVRCQALESLGYVVYTMDDKHHESLAVNGRHCQTNFSDARRMWECIQNTWEVVGILKRGFQVIILDYFFSPAGWHDQNWSSNFFAHVLPSLVINHILGNNGLIWLPNVGHVQKMIENYKNILCLYFEWETVADPTRNPLAKATDNANRKLELCPDKMTNETQLAYLRQASNFFVFKKLRKREIASRLSKIVGRKRGRKKAFNVEEVDCRVSETADVDLGETFCLSGLSTTDEVKSETRKRPRGRPRKHHP